MHRYINDALLTWTTQSSRLPLMIRGARQIGKSYTIRQFAKQNFEQVVEINFEYEPQYKECFADLNPQKIINEIELLSRKTITPHKTLLFLDEIQECPQAILALRYFKEIMPDLHVISAGSLVEFVLNDAEFRMPVGRVQYMFMHPLSFYEFLLAKDEENLINFLKNINLSEQISTAVHHKLISLFREYLIIGGMPDCINAYLSTNSYLSAQERQLVLLNTFKNDFGKYAKFTEHKYLQTVFKKAPELAGRQFKFVDIDPEARSRNLKAAIFKLADAGLIKPIFSTNAAGIPLTAKSPDQDFKLCLLDVGLMIRASNLSAELLLQEDFFALTRGKIMEQFVAQELSALQNPLSESELFYWYRDKKSATAEIDFVRQIERDIIPIEVKSGRTGRLKSLRIFMDEKKSKLGAHISLRPLSFEKNLLSLPAYMIAELDRLVRTI